MLLGKLGASLLANLLAGKGINKKGNGINRAGEGIVELEKEINWIFNATSSFNKF